MRGPRIKIRAADLLILLLALLVIGGISLRIYAGGGSDPQILVSSSDEKYLYPLEAEARLEVPGPLGDTVVHIHDGGVEVLSSPCPEKICIKTGRISRPGQWIACLPNRVFISIRGGEKEQPDAISQ
jgi:hypothetical protein